MTIQMFRSYYYASLGYLGAYIVETNEVLNPGVTFTSPERFAKWLRDYHPEAVILYPHPSQDNR